MMAKKDWSCKKDDVQFKWYFERRPETKKEKEIAKLYDCELLDIPKTKAEWKKAQLYASDDMGGYEFNIADSGDDYCKKCKAKLKRRGY